MDATQDERDVPTLLKRWASEIAKLRELTKVPMRVVLADALAR
jgi:hypothetical protein